MIPCACLSAICSVLSKFGCDSATSFGLVFHTSCRKHHCHRWFLHPLAFDCVSAAVELLVERGYLVVCLSTCETFAVEESDKRTYVFIQPVRRLSSACWVGWSPSEVPTSAIMKLFMEVSRVHHPHGAISACVIPSERRFDITSAALEWMDQQTALLQSDRTHTLLHMLSPSPFEMVSLSFCINAWHAEAQHRTSQRNAMIKTLKQAHIKESRQRAADGLAPVPFELPQAVDIFSSTFVALQSRLAAFLELIRSMCQQDDMDASVKQQYQLWTCSHSPFLSLLAQHDT
eukprot:GILK01012411.1.p1 GENE.GILK01012411.1~~GILK01012411.1.p1  ORF type:complete len:288 (-),score=37.51 GILK01012411.1:46-909(-)